ncbi:MAG: hypothetical protein RMA76_44005 [Deltaproteobacteria bacterium]
MSVVTARETNRPRSDDDIRSYAAYSSGVCRTSEAIVSGSAANPSTARSVSPTGSAISPCTSSATSRSASPTASSTPSSA